MCLGDNIGKYITKGYLSVSPTDTLETVARLMVETGNYYAVVMERGELKGLVSADEIIKEVMSSVVSRMSFDDVPTEVRQMLLSELMNNPQTKHFMESCGFEGSNLAVSIGESNTVEEAIQLLAKNSLDQVMVLDDQGLVGILKNTDLLKAITELTQ